MEFLDPKEAEKSTKTHRSFFFNHPLIVKNVSKTSSIQELSIHFFFIRTLCFWWGSNFLKLSPFKPYFFLFFFLILCVLRLNFLKFFLNFWCSKAIFSYFFKYFMDICYPGLENWPRIVKILPILYYYAFLVYFWPKTYNI